MCRHPVGENAAVRFRLCVAGAVLAVVLGSQAATGTASDGGAGGTCPAESGPTVVSARPGAGFALVPAGAETLLLCSYRGLNPPGRQAHDLLAQRTVTEPAEVATLSRQLDTLRPAPPLVACPLDDGSEVVASFLYREAPPDPVTVGLSGCELVSNGRLTRTASLPPGPALLGRLTALVRTAR
jgi:hypothetical protein